jgi:hypothetical protein
VRIDPINNEKASDPVRSCKHCSDKATVQALPNPSAEREHRRAPGQSLPRLLNKVGGHPSAVDRDIVRHVRAEFDTLAIGTAWENCQ